MPVILTTPEEVDLWLAADVPTALELQRPLPDEALRIVASGEKEDRAIGVFEEQSPLFLVILGAIAKCKCDAA